MLKPIAQMSAAELRAELDAAMEAEKLAEYQNGLTAWLTARDAAIERQRLCVDEMARRQAHWEAVNGAMGGMSGG